MKSTLIFAGLPLGPRQPAMVANLLFGDPCFFV